MVGALSRFHSFWRTIIGKKNKLLLIGSATVLLVLIASSTAYYLANYSVNSPIGEVKPQESISTPSLNIESRESSPGGDTPDVKGVQVNKEIEVSQPTYTAPQAVNPTTAPVQNYQTPSYQAPVIIYQPPTTSDSNSYPSPENDWYIERLHQQQEENAKRQEYCNQVRDQRSAAIAPYMAKRTEINNQMLDAIQKKDTELYRSLEKQYNEADKEFWSVYNSFDTSCI